MGDDRGPAGLELHYAPNRGRTLTSGLILSTRRTAKESTLLEIAVDDTIEASGAYARNLRSKPIGHVPLAPRDFGNGSIRYGEMELVVLPRLFRLDLVDDGGERIVEASCAVDTLRRSCFPAPDYDGITTSKGLSDFVSQYHFGPPGTQRCPGVINILKVQTLYDGITLDLLLDDAGRTRWIEVGLPESSLLPESQLDRIPCVKMFRQSPSPGRCQLHLPLGTTFVDLAGLDGEERPIEELSCRLHLDDLSFRPATGELQVTSPSPPVEPTVPARSPSTPAPHASPPIAETTRPRTSDQDRGELVRTLAMTGSSRHTVQEDPRKDWPASLGRAGTELGPPGHLSSTRALNLVRMESTVNGTRILLNFDDSGVSRSVRIGLEGRLLPPRRIMRPTPAAPGIVQIDLEPPPPGVTPVLFTMDRYEEVIPNLSTGLDTETETFVETALDPGLWPAQLKVGKAWDIERSLCLVCHRETRMSNLTPLTSLDSQTRRDIKRRFPPSPDRLGICPRCRPSIEASPAEPGTGWALDTDVILRILSRGFYLVMGCFLPHTLPGAVVAEAIAHPEVGFMAPLEATLLVSAVGGALFFLIPLKTLSWPLIAPFARIGDTTSGLDRSRFLLAGTFHAGLIYLFLNGRSLNHRVGLDHLVLLLPITMTCGVGLALIVAAIGHRILNLETEDQVRMSMRIKAMGTLALSLTGLEGIRRPDELVERILVVLREGMRATRFILYSWDDERSEYLAIHVEGEREVPPRAIAPDADGIIGRALGSQRSQIRSRRASRKLSVPAIGFPDPVLVVPVTASGRVRYLLCVEEIADAAWEEDLKPLLAPVTHLFARAAGRVEEPPPP